jgi:hypothetical protein
MGIWGLGAFENDDAADWVAEFRGSPTLQQLDDAFEAVLAQGGYLEIPECASAVAAASLLAQALELAKDEEVLDQDEMQALRVELANMSLEALQDLVRRAERTLSVAATDRDRSELFQVWHDEGEDGAAAWTANIEKLAADLRRATDRWWNTPQA